MRERSNVKPWVSLRHLQRFLNHKFITRCAIAVRSKVPSTLQYISSTTKRNVTRNVKQTPDHSQLIQTQEK